MYEIGHLLRTNSGNSPKTSISSHHACLDKSEADHSALQGYQTSIEYQGRYRDQTDQAIAFNEMQNKANHCCTRLTTWAISGLGKHLLETWRASSPPRDLGTCTSTQGPRSYLCMYSGRWQDVVQGAVRQNVSADPTLIEEQVWSAYRIDWLCSSHPTRPA